ncbi:P-loop containing nucleoside triphosphate hydrolase protein [Suillus decipiens]|nr:P-loop containing nucleoside triphosphate hydrolase protein [Suillus decipiens]
MTDQCKSSSSSSRLEQNSSISFSNSFVSPKVSITISDVSYLCEHFMSESIHTNIGTNSLVVVNLHKYVSSNADSSPLSPHIFQLTNNAYYHMKQTTQDYSEIDSGKSENHRLAIKIILELSVSNLGMKGSKLATQLPTAEFVIESFGNACTLFNLNASHFSKYTESQFTDHSCLSGVKTLDYYLEHTHVSSVPSGGHNFHIFCYLMAGAAQEECWDLYLLDKTQYCYLVPACQNGIQDNDTDHFEQLKVTLKTIGLFE